MSVNWLIVTTVTIAVMISLATFIGYLVHEHLKAKRNRAYKSLQDHGILNAGNRDDWMAGVLPSGEIKELNRFSTVIAPIIQLATVIVLAITVIMSNASMADQAVRQQEEISALETQMHALAFAGAAESSATKIDPDPAASILPAQPAALAASPMQLACANLIGRVADAYEKGESSKIALSLEELVKKLKCVNGMPQ
jgi:hypothetical protein